MNLGDAAYWELKYQEEARDMVTFELFDYYCPFSDLYTILHSLYDSTAVHKVLVIGVGRSDVIEFLYKQGYRDITAIDISETIIVEMQKKYTTYTGVEFFVMDTRQLHKFVDSTFTLIIDKGCIDALFCGTDYHESTTLAFNEIYRVLKKEGVFFSVTHAPSVARVPYFRCVKWALERVKVASHIGEGLTIFAMTKTDNEVMLSKKIPGAEAKLRSKTTKVVSNADQSKSKGSTTRSGSNTGSLTVTSSVDILAELVAESEEIDG